MYDFERVEVDSCLNDLADNKGSDVLRQVFLLFDKLVQVLAFYVLSDDVDMRLASNSLLIAHYFRMRDDLHYLALVIQHCDCLTCQLISTDILQSVGFARLFVSAAVHY